MHKKRGFVLIITFMMLSCALASVMLLFVFSFHHSAMMKVLTQKCYTLDCALTAPDFLKSILTPPEKEEEKQQKSEKSEKDEIKESQKRILYLWKYSQNFAKVFAADKEQSSNSISCSYAMMLGSEQGKVNINGLYDFAKSTWASPEKKAFCKAFFTSISKFMKSKDTQENFLFDAFEKYLKKREAPFNDVCELFNIPEFAKLFPPEIIYTGSGQSKNLYIGELFTVCTEQDTINCIGLSRSFALLVGAKQENMIELLQQKDKIQEVMKLSSAGEQGLVTLFDKVYGVDFKNIPQEFKSLLTMNFELNIFSIALTASVKKITSTVFAIIKLQTTDKTVTYDVMKVYQV